MWMEKFCLFPWWEACTAAMLRAKKAAETNRDGKERVGTGKRERTTGNRGESGHDKNNEKKREVQGQPEAVFPPRSLSGSGATRKLAGSTHCKTYSHVN